MKKAFYLLLVCLFTGFNALGQAQSPRAVMTQFFNALHNRDFVTAYGLCTGKRWGTLSYFSSPSSYGGISALEILSIREVTVTATTASLVCSTKATDKVNGTGTFDQTFSLKKEGDNQWSITGVKLNSSSRLTDSWNINMPAQPDFKMTDAKRLTKQIYDTVKNISPTENPEDIMIRSFKNLQFIKTDKGLFALAICENQGPRYGVYTGWCDAFAFKKEPSGWKLTSTLLQAGGGGRMGFPGRYERTIRVGDFKAGIVISSYFGQSGIELTQESIAAFENGKLSPLTVVATDYVKDASFATPPVRISNSYHFERNGNENYDLIIVQYDQAGSKHRKLKNSRIVYKNGYAIPEEYEFEN